LHAPLKFEDIPWNATFQKGYRPSYVQLEIVKEHVDLIIEQLKPTDKEIILDVGCGKGYLAHRFALLANFVVAMDVNSEYIRYAKKFHNLSNISYILCDAHYLPLRENSFDVITCREVIEHVAFPIAVLEEIRRVMRGRAIITTPNRLEIGHLIRTKFADNKILQGHLREYTFHEFKCILEKYFKLHKMRGTFFPLPHIPQCRLRLCTFLSRNSAKIFPEVSSYLTALVTKNYGNSC